MCLHCQLVVGQTSVSQDVHSTVQNYITEVQENYAPVPYTKRHSDIKIGTQCFFNLYPEIKPTTEAMPYYAWE